MARSTRPAGLPDFENPPVVEVVLSLQFDALEPIDFVEVLGSFRSQLRPHYPVTERHAPLPPAFEIFGAPAVAPHVSVQLQAIPDPPRFWMVNEAGTEILQIQTDRFAHNWRKVGHGDEYPRYERIRQTFLNEFSRLNRLSVKLLGRQLTPNQCELTYVNHADAGDALETLRIMDPATCGPELQGNWEDFVAQYRFVLPGIVSEADHPIGRLYVHAGAAFTKEGNQVFQLMLTARGRPFSPDLNGARGFMDSGRKAIVNNFAALTTERMHRIWGRRK